MGWWETEKGVVIGDPPLDCLEEFTTASGWQTPDDIAPEALSAIIISYRQTLSRDPRQAELEALLAFHRSPDPSDP